MEYLVANFKIISSNELLQTARELLADGAAEAGFESFEDTEEGLKGYVQKDFYDKEKLDECIEDFPIENVKISYSIENAENKDWNEAWELAGFDPICVDDTVLIYDAKHQEELHPAQASDHIEIGIDAVQAFGTGTHETTQMIVSTLLGLDLDGKRVLDCGCGTGILGITAAKLGAKDVVGYDIDEWSVENAKHNAKLNGVENIEIYEGDAHVLNHISGVFDLVMANINRNILLQDMENFKSVMNHGAQLILSGFYEEDIPLLIEKAKTLGLSEKGKKKNGNWICLLLGE
ncbi:50S ribosomal protein L11 methyltransferase [Segatella albensis]|uniref:50S ribosomal protein L11 methyltransferase n=1 Tax=Segatella albensis TaxID=77768 RepID=UPI0003FCA23E|nr:50S ribosomal protein L11 methyltransferase [Segatella albensis]